MSKTMITRIAPSPTGEMHIGTLGMAICNYMASKTHGGKFNIRIEDTDQKRFVEGSADRLLAAFKKIGLHFDNEDNIPYQSTRGEIYQSVANKLVADNKAYMDEGAIRLRAPENAAPVVWNDLVKGEMKLPPLERDPVILKSTGIPPYNLAHVIDDLAMGTTHVLRGEEWLASTAEHVQIFEAIHGTRQMPWQYAHLPVICVIDPETNNKRKLSKRKDKQALVDYFLDAGYPVDALIEYLLTIFNTDYELWRIANPTKPWRDFEFRFEKIGSNSPLFDWDKLNRISADMIAKLSCKEINAEVKKYFNALRDKVGESTFNMANAHLIEKGLTEKQYETVCTLLSVDRETERPRKDIAKYGDILTEFDYAFRPVKMSKLLETYVGLFTKKENRDEWFARVKEHCVAHGIKPRDYTQEIRKALTGREHSTDLYTITKVLLF